MKQVTLAEFFAAAAASLTRAGDTLWVDECGIFEVESVSIVARVGRGNRVEIRLTSDDVDEENSVVTK